MSFAPRLLPAALGLLLLGCGGGSASGDKAGAVNRVLQISPAQAELAPGQSIQFSPSGAWDGGLKWTVLPSGAGTISSTGVFTAGTAQGTVQILAVWSQDVRYTATASATILPAPPPAESTPSIALANGNQQTSSTGTSANASVLGESFPATTASSASGHTQLRHGFSPTPK